jgi:hypothetical protein
LEAVHVLHPRAVHEFQKTQVRHELVAVATRTREYIVAIERIAHEGIIPKVLSTPVLAGRVASAQRAVECGSHELRWSIQWDNGRLLCGIKR